jgi:hypothetical protein
MKDLLKVGGFCISVVVFVISIFSEVNAGIKIYEKDDVSLKLYGRMQPRFEWKEKDNYPDEINKGNDFYIRRTRLGVKAKLTENIKGKLEWKLDNYLQEGKEEQEIHVKLENAIVSFDYLDSQFIVEFGLQNSVFSREGQLSDSKFLFTDRSKIINKIQKEGLADNATGLYLKGKLMDKHLEYGLGVYEGGDGTSKEGIESDKFQYAAGLVYHIFDPEKMAGSHIGDGKTYLTVGAYYATQSELTADTDTYDISAYGADVFAQFDTITFSSGYFVYKKDFEIQESQKNDGYYIEGAYLLPQKVGIGELELAARYQAYTPDSTANTYDERQTSLGINYYIKKHSIKVQTTYNINEEDKDYNYDPGNNLVTQLQFAW